MTRSVPHTVAQEKVSATLTVAAIDGTGWVQEPLDRVPLTEVGQIFGMGSITPAIRTVTTRSSTKSRCSTRRAPSAG